MNLRALRTLATAGALVALTVGMLPAKAATPADVLVVAQSIDDAVSFDPAEGYELTPFHTFNNVYQRLVQTNPTDGSKLEGGLAESWEQAADGKSITFKLKDGAKFASGNPVRPEDVVYSFVRATKLGKTPVFILQELGWKPENIESLVSKVDDSHVKVGWAADIGSNFALAILTAPIASVVDEKEVASHATGDDFGNAWLKTNSAGSGQFSIKAYQPHEALVLAANPTSPAGAPKVKSVIFKNVADASARRLLIEQGDADIARDLGADQIASLAGKPGIVVEATPSAQQDYVIINSANKDVPALGNPAFWEASRYLVDYDGIANKLLKGQYIVHQTFLPEGFPGAISENPFTLDPAKAKAILEKAGLKDVKFKLTVSNQPPFTDIAQSLQASFAQGGVTLEIEPVVASELYGKLRARNYEAAALYWFPDYFDANSNAAAFAYGRGDEGPHTVAWRAGWNIPEISDQTHAAVVEQDPAKRAALYGEIQREVQKSSPLVFILQAKDQIVLRDNVKGYVQGINADQVFFGQVEKH
ncbi:ABC transporter substrate-binding protein [Kaistia dalseonensis]|uniref:Peptide/nickel transport system substrate-binding protein n=1 Tax=Kaistia dalseonensis TaxID=410840 RepID=A0ABU0H8J5_9HYPH|nr:ABC transporter substrate-binding protein [Kaistia dalseonensis]MCX5496031.1 ABC transporter substrate-binding protein [Kaistia dalseonensis]MDQ0438635.1 peptide/nickel transport system substrate-binding protein [Kaistia dalseonensis]